MSHIRVSLKQITILIMVAALLVAVVLVTTARRSGSQIALTASRDQTSEQELATFAGGCFWCIEAVLQEIDGVLSAVSGYMGGQADTAKYQLVVSGTTGHREVVQVTYDPDQVSYQELMDVFFTFIDPTDPGGQFADRGFLYTTALYYHSDTQRQLGQDMLSSLETSGEFDAPIVTKLLPASTFYAAEEYHQDYYLKSSEAYKRYEQGSGRADYVAERVR